MTLAIPVYNGERYLADTIETLLRQDFKDFELVVSDNASSDGTVSIVQRYAAMDNRVRLLRNRTNLGAAANYNRLVHEAQAELFKWCGYDDLLSPTYLSRCVAALDTEPSAALAFSQTLIIDAAGSVVKEYDDRLDLRDDRPWMRVAQYARRVNLCNACFGVMRRDIMLRTGLIRPYVSSDIPFLAEMAAYGKFLQVPEPLFRRRIHQGSSRQGLTTMAEVARWFDPARTAAPMAPRLTFLAGTVRALSAVQAPVHQRLAVAGAYTSVTALRRTRMRVGRLRAALVGRAVPPREMVHELEVQHS